MEEDIKILEKFIEYVKKKDEIKFISPTEIHAIQNLIARYKELEKYKKYYETEKIIWSRKDYIPKSKVKEKIKKYEWAIEHYDCDEADYRQSQDVGSWHALQELLED